MQFKVMSCGSAGMGPPIVHQTRLRIARRPPRPGCGHKIPGPGPAGVQPRQSLLQEPAPSPAGSAGKSGSAPPARQSRISPARSPARNFLFDMPRSRPFPGKNGAGRRSCLRPAPAPAGAANQFHRAAARKKERLWPPARPAAAPAGRGPGPNPRPAARPGCRGAGRAAARAVLSWRDGRWSFIFQPPARPFPARLRFGSAIFPAAP